MIYNDIALFTAVANHLSFSAAADQLEIPLSRVSRRVADLEDHLGIKLFERTTRRVRLTEEGRRLLDRCQGPVEALQEVIGFAEDAGRQIIRVTAPPLAVRTSIGPKLLSFAAQHPQISVNLTTATAFLDFFRDNIDLAFRLGPLEDSSLVARHLWSVPYGFCVGRSFAEQEGLDEPITTKRLENLPAIVSRQPWLLESGEQLRPRLPVHQFDDLDLVLEAVRRNMGVALLPTEILTPDVGVLELIDAAPRTRDMYAVYPGRRLLPARIRMLIDFMAETSPL